MQTTWVRSDADGRLRLSALVGIGTLVMALGATTASPSSAQERPGPSTPYAVGASVLLPGSGQLLSGERRGFLYLAADAALWVVFADQRSEAGAARDAYRDLAWDVARGGPQPRVDGDFEYYERLTDWPRSGAFDRDPGSPGLQPETDPITFNGHMWGLARSLFWGGASQPPDPAAESAALDYYRDRAYTSQFAWDWSDAPDARVRYTELIRESDDAFGRARLAVGGLLANRVLSGVDAWLSARTPGTTRMRVVPGTNRSAARSYLVVRWIPGGNG